ncbi:MAG: hypothetical protein LBC18_07730 [Opitutaceae bacterium]|jgi:hypothetical protein|nr:hypothetical protein [Opitutaceae bacterium]
MSTLRCFSLNTILIPAACLLAACSPSSDSPERAGTPAGPGETPAPAAAPVNYPQIIEQNGQKLAFVSAIRSVELNREFQHNVQVLQAKHANFVELKKRVDEAKPEEKDALQKQLDEALKNLDADNTVMTRTYGFSLLRNYVIFFAKTRLYTPLNDEEFAKLSPEDRAKPDLIRTIDGRVHLYIASIESVTANENFRRNVQLVQAQREHLVQTRQALDNAKTDDEKAKLQEELAKTEDQLKKNIEEFAKLHGITPLRNYLIEVEESWIYTPLSPEEAKQIEEKQLATGTTPQPAAGQ